MGNQANGHRQTPGPDSIAIEFYHKCWHIIGDDFTQFLNKIHGKGIIPDEIKNGIITLVYQKNKKEDHRNYRPISLLNTDLKIYTKILANRLVTKNSTIISIRGARENNNRRNHFTKRLTRLCHITES